MEEGPFRASRPADRRAVSRPEPAYRQPEEPQPVNVEPQAPAPQKEVKQKKPSRRLRLPIAIAIVVLIVAGVVGWFVWSGSQNQGTAIDSSKYQAVFFTNGQVYFGKLHTFNNESLKLTDIYYLQTQASSTSSQNPQQTSNAQTSNVQLIKLGDEIHGPEDEMVLSKAQVLFYENLKPDSKVVTSIEQYKKSH
jgi:flagellar basal body-associated protein FliL